MKRVITQSRELLEGWLMLDLKIVKVAVVATTEDGVEHVLGTYDNVDEANKEMMKLHHYTGKDYQM